MTAPVLASPAAEVRRLRAERDHLASQLAALLGAVPDLLAEIDYRRRFCRWAAAAERERAREEGYVAAIEHVKATEHALVDAIRLVSRRHAPGGSAWADAVERNGGTEYGGAGRPRVPVTARAIERAREARAA